MASLEVKVDFDTAAMQKLFADLRDDAAEAMARAAYEESQKQVPRNTGRLARSGRVERRKDGESAVTYGGPEARYAAVVHDKPGVRYRRGKWKFLRDPLMKARCDASGCGGALQGQAGRVDGNHRSWRPGASVVPHDPETRVSWSARRWRPTRSKRAREQAAFTGIGAVR